MQIVIDIPKEMMSYINKNEFNAISEAFYGSMAMLAIKNGTPLPKGHGRLIDADALGEELHRYTEAPYQYALKVFNDAPTIIEADKVESEG